MDTETANGNGFNETSFAIAHARMVSAPLALTDDDFAQLEKVHPSLATKAHQLRAIAKRWSSRAVTRAKPAPTRPAALPVVSCLDPNAAIEALDRKAGRVHTLDDFRRIGEKSSALLTEDDITLIRYFSGEKSADDARTRRAKAIAPAADSPKPPAAAMTKREAPITRGWSNKNVLNIFEKVIVPGLKKALAERDGHIAALEARLKAVESRPEALEARLKAVESRPELKYVGVWRHDGTYTEGALATHSGSLWLAISSKLGTPGSAASGWQLVVKNGGVR